MGKRTNTAVWLEKYKRWQIKVQKDGGRRSFTSSTPGRKGQRECNAKADAWLDDGIIGENIKLSVLIGQWLEEIKITTSKGNWHPYDSYIRNWINPKIGNIRMGNLNEQHLQNVITATFTKGHLSEKTLKNIRACMITFMKYARKCRGKKLMPENITIPKSAEKSHRQTLQPDDLKTLFSVDNTTRYGIPAFEWFIYAYRFQAVTGLRPGEIAGLKSEDVKGSVLSVRRAINRYGETTRGKTKNAIRSYELSKRASAILEQQKSFLKKSGLISAFLFPGENGKHINQNTYREHWTRYSKAAGITEGRVPYELRHTFVSVNKDIPQPLLQPVVGHSKNMDTFSVYGHELNDESSKTAQLIDEAFDRVLK